MKIPGLPHGKVRITVLALGIALVALFAFEAYRAVVFVQNVNAGVDELRALRGRMDVDQLDRDVALLEQDRESLEEAAQRLEDARGFSDGDLLLKVAGNLPLVGKQVDGARSLVRAADQSAKTGLEAVELAIAFARYEPNPEKTAVEEAIVFIESQAEPLARVRASLDELKATRAEVPDGLAGPMDNGVRDLDESLEKLESLVQGYERAHAFLPELLGYDGERRYLLLPQNNTELFPSGGLISSYGIVTVNAGRLESIELEYFGTLFERWQRETGEYIEPPPQLKNYLKKDYSWALGEAGWYPDFVTTARLANDFVMRGGAPATDGTIAIDMHFMRELLDFLGPVEVPEYEIMVDAANFDEVSLEYTRAEFYEPGLPKKAFLSYLAREVISRLLTTPKEDWVDMVTLLDRAGRERHLQLAFHEEGLQTLARQYGFVGSLQSHATDYLLITDTSVNSTKLNLILENTARVAVQLTEDGAASTSVEYSARNPFPEWQEGRDPDLVSQLMLQGVYGGYLRIYAPRQARLHEVLLNESVAGVEQVDVEFGRSVFGRYFRVLPGDQVALRFEYETRDVIRDDDGESVYTLGLSKQAGTDAIPMSVSIELPPGAELVNAALDGKPVETLEIETDLREDRLIEVRFKRPS